MFDVIFVELLFSSWASVRPCVLLVLQVLSGLSNFILKLCASVCRLVSLDARIIRVSQVWMEPWMAK